MLSFVLTEKVCFLYFPMSTGVVTYHLTKQSISDSLSLWLQNRRKSRMYQVINLENPVLIFFSTLILRARLHVPHVPQADATMAATVSWKPRASSGWLMVAVRNPLLDSSWKEKPNLLDCKRKPLNRVRFVRSFFVLFRVYSSMFVPSLLARATVP